MILGALFDLREIAGREEVVAKVARFVASCLAEGMVVRSGGDEVEGGGRGGELIRVFWRFGNERRQEWWRAQREAA